VPFEEQVADILTKGLSVKKFEDLASKLGMWDIHSPVLGGLLAHENFKEKK